MAVKKIKVTSFSFGWNKKWLLWLASVILASQEVRLEEYRLRPGQTKSSWDSTQPEVGLGGAYLSSQLHIKHKQDNFGSGQPRYR
jgi:hypothetical protein